MRMNGPAKEGRRNQILPAKLDRLGVAMEAQKCLRKSDYHAALAHCNSILDDDPQHLGALEVQAQAQWYAGHYEEVIRSTSTLLRINPGEPGYRYTRGMALMAMGRYAAARRDFEDALRQSHEPEFLRQVRAALDALDTDTPVEASTHGRFAIN